MVKGILILIGSALGTTLFLFVTFFFIGGDAIELTILNAHGYLFNSPDGGQVPVSDAIQIKNLIEKGYVVNTGDLISDISNFYSGIIEFLVVIIGILGVVAFMYVRAGSESVAEAKASEVVKRFFESQAFYDLLDDQTNKKTKELRESLKSDLVLLEESMEQIGKSGDRLDEIKNWSKKLEVRLKVIEDKLSLIDSDEMEGSNEHITISNEGES